MDQQEHKVEKIAQTGFVDVSPYGRLERRGRKWYLVGGRPDVTMMLRRIFPGVLSRGDGAIALPINQPGFWTEFNWFMKLYPLDVRDRKQRISAERLIAKALAHTEAVMTFAAHLDRPSDLDLPLRLPLRQYQKKAVEAIALQKRLLVADDVGLGKTAVAIASTIREGCFPVLYVTMTQLNEQAVREFGKFVDAVRVDDGGRYRDIFTAKPHEEVDDESVLVVHRIDTLQPYELPAADVYIMKYSCLRGWRDLFERKVFRYVVFDECQELRRKGTAKYRAAQVVARHAEYCVGLTATPIYNYGDEVYSILNLIKPHCLGPYRDFVAEWGRLTKYKKLLIEEPAALGAMLKEQLLMVRRTLDEVGLELPEVQHVVEFVDHDVRVFNESVGEILELAKRSLFGWTAEDRMTSRGQFDMKLRRATGLSKAHYVAARTRIVLESGHPVVLVGWHRDVYDIWCKVLDDFQPVMITGSESPDQKERNKQAFIRGESPLLILSLRSGEGMDGLQQTGSIVVFGELDWSPQIHHQIIGRLHRYGQREHVLALFLVSSEGSDPAVADILDLKSEQAFKIMNPEKDYAPELDTRGGEKRLQEIAADLLRRYKVDLDKARAEFETKEPPSYWQLASAIESFVWDRNLDEKYYQERLHAHFREQGLAVAREVAVHGGIVDMLTEDGVGVEIKLSPVPQPALLRQIRAYIQDDRLRAMVVIHPRPGDLPERLYGKRIAEFSPRLDPVFSSSR